MRSRFAVLLAVATVGCGSSNEDPAAVQPAAAITTDAPTTTAAPVEATVVDVADPASVADYAARLVRDLDIETDYPAEDLVDLIAGSMCTEAKLTPNQPDSPTEAIEAWVLSDAASSMWSIIAPEVTREQRHAAVEASIGVAVADCPVEIQDTGGG